MSHHGRQVHDQAGDMFPPSLFCTHLRLLKEENGFPVASARSPAHFSHPAPSDVNGGVFKVQFFFFFKTSWRIYIFRYNQLQANEWKRDIGFGGGYASRRISIMDTSGNRIE